MFSNYEGLNPLKVVDLRKKSQEHELATTGTTK